MIESIIKGFEIWTDAQGLKSKGRVKNIENISLDGITRLRELILELAVSGKLVPQNTEDKNAHEVVDAIIKEKRKLILLGELSKEKELLDITEKEKFIALPTNWEWVKLGIIGTTNIGLTYSPNDVSDNGLIVLRSSNVQNGEIDLSDLVRVTKNVDEKVLVKEGDLLICARNGSRQLVGKCALIKTLDEPMAFGAFMAIYRCNLNNYIKLFVESPAYRRNLEGVSTTTINQITQDNLRNTIIPLPPLEEQTRIIEKVNELFAVCDKLEQENTNNLTTHHQLVKSLLETLTQAKDADELQSSWRRISEHFDTLFCTEDSVEQLKQSLLSLVIQGRFRTQNLSDTPATILYELIQEELTEKYGKSFSEKLERDKSTIEPSDFHVVIPKSWIWCELQDLAIMFNGKAHEQFVDDNGEFILVNSSFVSSDGKSAKFVSSQLTPLTKGDIAIVMSDVPDGNALVKCYLVEEDNKYTLNQRIGGIKTSNHIDIHYLFLVLNRNRYYLQYNDGKKQSNLKKIQILSCPIPLPPVEEQKRIVSKVAELFAMCDSLQDKIVKAKEIKTSLSKSVVQLV